MGKLGGAVSPARTFSPVVGAEIRLRGERAVVPLDPSFEHAIYAVEGSLAIEGSPVAPDVLAYLGLGRGGIELSTGDAGATAFLLGGEPFREEVLMWWNFVARTDAEMQSARRDWIAGSRFGPVSGYPGRRLEAPPYSARQRAAPR
jgi:redox-sensitive bicupin YhaK (pirin superfamily)